MDELSNRSAQEVLDDHLNLAKDWGGNDIERSIQDTVEQRGR